MEAKERCLEAVSLEAVVCSMDTYSHTLSHTLSIYPITHIHSHTQSQTRSSTHHHRRHHHHNPLHHHLVHGHHTVYHRLILLSPYATITPTITHHYSPTSLFSLGNFTNMSPLSETLSPQKLFRSPSSHRRNSKKNMRRMLSRGGGMTRGGSERRLGYENGNRKSGRRSARSFKYSEKSGLDEGEKVTDEMAEFREQAVTTNVAGEPL